MKTTKLTGLSSLKQASTTIFPNDVTEKLYIIKPTKPKPKKLN